MGKRRMDSFFTSKVRVTKGTKFVKVTLCKFRLSKLQCILQDVIHCERSAG